MIAQPNIGFIQGRLSPLVGEKIQAFPFKYWRDEFKIASEIGLNVMEWTIDTYLFADNPLVNTKNTSEIIKLCEKYQIKIPSVTCDYFMENPPWKSNSITLERNIVLILNGMSVIGAKILVVPLVDNSSIINSAYNLTIVDLFIKIYPLLKKLDIKIAFETDLPPDTFLKFIEEFDVEFFGINYDIGNSASLNYNPQEELSVYGHRVINVHVKDRLLGGSSLPLGQGNADFNLVFNLLKKFGYSGNLILQTARSSKDNHKDELVGYKSLVEKWWKESSGE
jgi:hexulose-6-phosphate isomerase